MVTLRESPGPALTVLAPVGRVLGEPRFRWRPHAGAWLYRVDLVDDDGLEVARGWSGLHELPLAWLKGPRGQAPRLAVGRSYRWRVYAYQEGPDQEPSAASREAGFVFVGP